MTDIRVSIICNTYNHENYIKDALDGFLMQKTDFGYEVLVHDDASTDGTAEIIRRYEAKYPELIKPIYRTENQYSKDPGVIAELQNGRAEGEYIALCEGDDYWTDPYKLQKQYDAMRKNPGVDISAHMARAVSFDTKKCVHMIAPGEADTVFGTEAVIAGGGEFVATSSIMYRRELNSRMPDYVKKYGYDYALQIYASFRGGMLYLADCMSDYRVMTPNSWSEITYSSPENRRRMVEELEKFLNSLNKNTGYLYDEVIKGKILREWFYLANSMGEYASLKKGEFGEFFKALPLKHRLQINAGIYMPQMIRLMKKIKRRLKG